MKYLLANISFVENKLQAQLLRVIQLTPYTVPYSCCLTNHIQANTLDTLCLAFRYILFSLRTLARTWCKRYMTCHSSTDRRTDS